MPRIGATVPWLAVAVVPLGFLGLFYFFPIWSILAETLSPGVLWDSWTASRGILWFTVWQAVISTLLTTAAAFPVAYVLARFDFRGKAHVRALLLVPFVLPTVVVAAAMTAVFDRFGATQQLQHSLWAILLAHVFFNFAIVARTLGTFWGQLSRAPEEAALTLGVGQWRTFWKVTLPRLMPALWGTTSIVFLFCFTSFGVILILGGPRRATLDTEIWRQAVLRQEFSVAAALVVLQIATVLVIMWFNVRWSGRGVVAERLLAGGGGGARPVGARQKMSVVLSLSWAGLLLGVPLAVLVERSLSQRSGGYSLSAYRSLFETAPRQGLLFVDPAMALRNSLVTAVMAAAIAVVVGVLAGLVVAYARGFGGRLLDLVLVLPLGTSAVAVGFGLLLALDTKPLDWRFSWWLIPVTHALVGVPFVLRAVVPTLRAIGPDVRSSARLLGASQMRLWHSVDLALAGRAILSAWGFAFAVSLGEFGASIFLVRPDRPTVPVVIYRLLSRPGELAYTQALALSTILMLVIAAVIWTVEQLGSRRGLAS